LRHQKLNMKNIILLSTISLLLLSCGGDTKNTMTVTGNVKGLKKGTLYLQHVPDSVLTTIDSLQIEGNGNFTFTTELESPEIFYLYLSKKDASDLNDRITFFGEPGTITINTSWNTFDTNAKITGSESQEKLEEYRKTMSRFNMKTLEIVQMANDPNNVLDSLQLDSVQTLSDKNVQRGYAFSVNFAINNKNSYIAPYIALNEVPDANVKYLDSIYNVLSPEVSESKYGKQLKTYLESIKK